MNVGGSVKRLIGSGGWSLRLALSVLILAVGGFLLVATVYAAPQLTVSQLTNSKVRAELKDGSSYVTDDDIEWRWLIGDNGNCASIDYDQPTGTATNRQGFAEVTVSSGHDLKYICFKATYGSSSYKFGTQVDLAGPVLTINQNGSDILVATNDVAANMVTSGSSALAALSYKSNISVCDSSVTGFVNTGVSLNDSFNPTNRVVKFIVAGSSHGTSDQNQICLRVKDKFDNFSYQAFKYSTAIPALTAVQGQNQLELSSTSAVNWQIEKITGSISDSTCQTNNGTVTSTATRFHRSRLVANDLAVCAWAIVPATGNSTKVLYILDKGWEVNAQVAINQSGPYLTFTAPNKVEPSGLDQYSGNLKKLSENATLTTRFRLITGYDTNPNQIDSNDCNSDSDLGGLFAGNFVAPSGSTVSNISTGNSTTLTGNSYDAVCVEIKDSRNHRIYRIQPLTDFQVGQPYIKAQIRSTWQRNLTVELGNLGSYETDYWYHGQPAASSSISCSLTGDAPNSNLIAGSRRLSRISLSDSDFKQAGSLQRYLCLRVQISQTGTDPQQLYAVIDYGLAAIDTVGPTVTVSQARAQVTAIATDTDSGLDSDSWGWTILTGITSKLAAERKCQAKPSPASPALSYQAGSSASLSPGPGRYICFKVSDKAGNTSYKTLLLSAVTDSIAPTIKVTLSRNRLIHNVVDNASDGLDTTSYEHVLFKAGTGPGSCLATAGVNWDRPLSGAKTSLVEADNGSYYCFRASDTSRNTGYLSRPLLISGVDKTAPVLTVSQINNRLTATANETVSGWQSHQSASQTDCDDDQLVWTRSKDVSAGSQVTDLQAADVGSWFCFRAKDGADNYGYKQRQVGPITTSVSQPDPTVPPAAGVTVGFTAGDGRLEARLIAETGTAPAARGYRYLFYTNYSVAQSQCLQGGAIDSHPNPGTVRMVAINSQAQAYCWRIQAADGNNYYGLYRVNQAADSTDDSAADTADDADSQPPLTEPAVTDQPVTEPGSVTPVEPVVTTPVEPADNDQEESFWSRYWVWLAISGVVVVAAGIIIFVTGSRRD